MKVPKPKIRPEQETSRLRMRTNISTWELATIYRCSENVGIAAVIVPELQLRDVQWQIFAADFVEASDDTALEDRSETFNRIGVDRADNVLSLAMIDNAMRVSVGNSAITWISIGAEQANFCRNSFVDKFLESCFVSPEDDAGDDVALAPYGTHDGGFEPIVAAPTGAAFLVPMTVLVLAANIGFIDLHDAAELVHVPLNQSGSDFVSHEPSGFDRTEAHIAANLARTHTLFAGEHQVGDLEPVAQWLVGILEDRPGDDRKPIAILCALLALPVPLAGRQVIDRWIAATRTVNALGPSAGLQIGLAGILIIYREHAVELGGSQLVDGLWHGSNPSQWKEIAL